MFSQQTSESENEDEITLMEHVKVNFGPMSLKEAVEKLSSAELKIYAERPNILLQINFKINEAFGDNLHEIFVWGNQNSILIIIESAVNDAEARILWKCPKFNKFCFVEDGDNFSNAVSKFLQENLIGELKMGNSGILNKSANKTKLFLRDIGNENDENILIFASKVNNSEVVKELLDNGFDAQYEDSIDATAIDYAWTNHKDADTVESKEKSEKIILNLLNANSPFPKRELDFEYNRASAEVQKFIDFCDDVHRDVTNANVEALKKKILEKPNLRHFFNTSNESIMFTASKNPNMDIFKLLISFSISPGPNEDLEEIYEKFNTKDLIAIRNEHRFHSKEFPSAHIFVLMSKSKIGSNDRDHLENWKYIEEAYKILDQIEPCSKILKVAALCKDLQIFFDFKQDSVYYINPTLSIGTLGSVNTLGTIYIGAKGLLEEGTMYGTCGVIIHELCHLAVLMVFMNNFDPYSVNGSNEKTKYEKVVVECTKMQTFETIVGNVFSLYIKEHQHSELIVTVVQMIVMYYSENPEADTPKNRQLKKCKTAFELLFKYFKEEVEQELVRAVPVLKILYNLKTEIKYSQLTRLMRTKLKESDAFFQGVKLPFGDIVEREYEILESLTSNQIRRVLLYGRNIEVGDDHKPVEKLNVVDRKIFENFTKGWERIVLVVDKAGAGKTVAFECLAGKLKVQYANCWVSLIKLRLYRNIFADEMKKKRDLNYDIVLDILIDVLDIQDDLDVKVFKKKFKSNKVILLFDGVDEISPDFYDFCIKMLWVLKNKTNNRIWVSTRPQNEVELKQELEVKTHCLFSFTKDERNELIKKISKINQVSQEFNSFFDKIESNHKNRDFNNPLIITILTQLYINKNIDLKSDKLNLFDIFDKVISKQREMMDYKIKSDDKNPFSNFTLLDLHFVFALNFILNIAIDDEIKSEDLAIVKNWKYVKDEFKPESIQRFGYLTIILGTKPLSVDFIHTTYAEFYVTDFIMSFFFKPKFGVDVREFQKVFALLENVLNNNNQFCIEFLLDYLKNNSRAAKINEEMKDIIISKIECRSIFFKSVSSLKFWALLVQKEADFVEKFWQIREGKTLLEKIIRSEIITSIDDVRSFFELLVHCFGSNWHEMFNKSHEKLTSDEEIEKETGKVDDFGKNVLKFLDYVHKNYNSVVKGNLCCKLVFDIKILAYFNKNVENVVMLKICEIFEGSKIQVIEFLIHKIENDPKIDLKFLGEKIEQFLSHDRESIRRVLFYDYGESLSTENSHTNHPLILSIKSADLDLFLLYKNLYIKYMENWNEIRNIFIFEAADSKKINFPLILTFLSFETYHEFKIFLIEMFKSDEEVFGRILHERKNIFIDLIGNVTTVEKLAFFIDLSLHYLNLSEIESREFYREILFFDYTENPLIESLLLKNAEYFYIYKELYIKYKDSYEELQQIFIQHCQFTAVISNIQDDSLLQDLMQFIEEIFESNKLLLLKCIKCGEGGCVEDPVTLLDQKHNVCEKLLIEGVEKVISYHHIIYERPFNHYNIPRQYFHPNDEEFDFHKVILSSYEKFTFFKNLVLFMFENNCDKMCKFINNFFFNDDQFLHHSLFVQIEHNFNVKMEFITNDEKMKIFEELSFCHFNGDEGKSKDFVKTNLFFDNQNPFLMAAKLQNVEKITNFIQFCEKYVLLDELRNILVSSHCLPQLFSELSDEIYSEYKKFLNRIFEHDKSKIFECIKEDCWGEFNQESKNKIYDRFEDFSSDLFRDDFESKNLFISTLRSIFLNYEFKSKSEVVGQAIAPSENDEDVLENLYDSYNYSDSEEDDTDVEEYE